MDQNVAYEVFRTVFGEWRRVDLEPVCEHQDNISSVNWYWARAGSDAYSLKFIVNLTSLRDASLDAATIFERNDRIVSQCDGDVLNAVTVAQMWSVCEAFIAEL